MDFDYQPLPLKYRPRRWADLVGQDAVVRICTEMLRQKRLVPSLICTASFGSGKTTTARILARSLNCLSPDGVEPCLECSACIAIGDENSFAVQEMDGASQGLVADVRNIKQELNYVSMDPGCKVYIIDEAHALSSQAWSAFLKILEEPPPNVIFVFCTTEADKIPDTIISRSMMLPFRRISQADIQARLRFVCDAENIIADDATLRLIARRSPGMRDALTILDQARTYSNGMPITPDIVQELVMGCSPDQLWKLTHLLVVSDLKGAWGQLQTILKAMPDASVVIDEWADMARGLMLVQMGIEREVTDISDDKMREISSKVPLNYWVNLGQQLMMLRDRCSRSQMPTGQLLMAQLPLMLPAGLSPTLQVQPVTEPVVVSRPTATSLMPSLTPAELAARLGGVLIN